mmetsp:Transcript_2767/g.7424  ORF Transcript_2767/g.7424 Transcript_2767/m.7424 type:complete len:244 (-) Transcript_2767:20-751(-)|eukprot:CAMPEP_0171256636 /NCGR_PEP_ID=MMETSP0790-20130122/53415_1 /TAXON_ID=2925 /ORGANISM="Alexandrium catenella, Strain OF101" /LENGTH=243 /DNA_ID=CAMNT_0011724687 /DNA_START=56 /DNA_END=787 /DNA_ORIENTATION=-
MGQATGLSTRRLCHTQEIAHGPLADEWTSLGQWTLEVEDSSTSFNGDCRAAVGAAWGVTCCAGEESGPRPVEEVLVVHHDALRKVDFLLRVDELAGTSCELPSVPECVVAAKRAELNRRIGGLEEASDEEEDRGFDVDSDCDCGTSRGSEDDGVGRERRLPRARRPMPGMPNLRSPGPVTQPRRQELPEDDPQGVFANLAESLPVGSGARASVPCAGTGGGSASACRDASGRAALEGRPLATE